MGAARAGRNGAVQLGSHYLQRLAGAPLRLGLAHANDGGKASPDGRLRLGPDLGVGLAMVGPTLGMPHDDEGGACIGQHFSGQIARMGAGRHGVAILCADLDA